MHGFSNTHYLTASQFGYLNATNPEDNYLVQTGKICEVVFSGLAINTYYSKNLPVSLPTDYKNVFCNAYAKVITKVQGYAVGDIIPLSSFWGNNYRSFTYWYNRTQCGFSTSNQYSVNNKNTADTSVSLTPANIEIHFDFYLIG